MKKLMFVAVATLCGAVMADNEITSENIVGYANGELISGSKAASAQFVTVGTNGVWLSDLVLDLQGDKVGNSVKITILDENGYGVGTPYIYWNNAHKTHKTTGWYQGTTIVVPKSANDHFFKAGEGMWFTSPKDTYGFVSSGEVLTKAQTFNLIAGSRLVANPFPAAIKLSDLTLNLGGDKVGNTLKITILDANGYGVGTPWIYWNNAHKTHKTTGWYQGTTLVDATTVTFPAGSSLWITSPKDTYTVTIAAPFSL